MMGNGMGSRGDTLSEQGMKQREPAGVLCCQPTNDNEYVVYKETQTPGYVEAPSH